MKFFRQKDNDPRQEEKKNAGRNSESKYKSILTAQNNTGNILGAKTTRRMNILDKNNAEDEDGVNHITVVPV